MELDIDRLFSYIPSGVTYSPLPRFPYVERDLAIAVPDEITAAAVEYAIWSVSSDIIESVTLFDIYKGKPVPDGRKSLAFSIRYRAGDRTLTDLEVTELHSKIISVLEDTLKAELRS
jgi:phenylalanyl-tRNA synthetase beta chain